MNCEEAREHLESCAECRLHVAVEARLRTQPVLEPPRGLVNRVMRALPRSVPLGQEIARLAVAAAVLIALVGAVFIMGLDRHQAAIEARSRGSQIFQSMVSALNPLGSEMPWKR
jgi:hypothetical protein